MKISTFKNVRYQEATWAELSPIWVPKTGPKWSPRGSQDGAKNEKKNEVNLGRVSVSLGRVKGKRCEVVTRPLGETGRPRSLQDRPKMP